MNKTIIATITIGVIAATLIAAETAVTTTVDATALDKLKKTIEKLEKSAESTGRSKKVWRRVSVMLVTNNQK